MKLNVGLGIVAAVISLAAFSPQQVRADEYGVVRGRVLDAESGQGVSGVEVSISTLSHGYTRVPLVRAITGPQGYFSFLGVAPGHYVVGSHRTCNVAFADVSQGEATTVRLYWIKKEASYVSYDCWPSTVRAIPTASSYTVEDWQRPGFLSFP